MPSSTPLPLLDSLGALLHTRFVGRAVRGFDEIDSTNTVAAAWAAEGAPEGALVFAEYQAHGRGRLGRRWSAPPGVNLTFSLVLHPPLPTHRLTLLPLVAAVAVADAITPFVAPVPVTIKWPNDVLLGGLKTCGLLLETTTVGSRAASVVLGIGLNVNQTTFEPDHADRASSMALAANRPLSRTTVFAAVLDAIEDAYVRLCTGGGDSLLARYEQRLDGRGAPVTLYATTGGAPVTGLLEGVTSTGALRILAPEGPRTFHAGDVTSRTE